MSSDSTNETDRIPDEILAECDGVTDEDLPPCSSHAGHMFTAVNDEQGGPQTRMVCSVCDASRPVREGDLDRRHGEYPSWVDESSTTTEQEDSP